MNIGRYLKKLLLENETVIIPGLGAFIPEYKPAQMNEESGEILPPSKTFRFDERIKNNDGILAGYIAGMEQISPSEALRKIEHEKEEILFRLDKKERVMLSSLGDLTIDTSGEIIFTPTLKENLLLDAYGLEPVSPSGDQTDNSLPEEIPIASTALSTDPLEERSVATEPWTTMPEEPLPPDHSSRGGGRWWIWLLLILLIAASGAYLWLKPQKKESAGPVAVVVEPVVPDTLQNLSAGTDTVQPQPTPTDTLQSQAADTISIDATAPAVPEVTTPESETPDLETIVPDSTKFYLIGGSFKEQKNARKFFRQMAERGYEPFHLMKDGNFYIVGLAIYDTQREAFRAQLDFIDRYPDSGAWVLMPGK